MILHNAPPIAEAIRREVVRVGRRFAAHNEDVDVTYNRYGYDTAAWYHAEGIPLAEVGPIPSAPTSRSSAWPNCGIADPARRRPARRPDRRPAEGRRAVRDSLIVTLGGQVERALGTVTALMLRWGLDPAQLGVYTGLRLYLDNTNRSSLGVGLGAVQEIPVLRAAGREAEARRVADVAHTTNTLTCLAYALGLLAWAWLRAPLWPTTRGPPSGPGAWWPSPAWPCSSGTRAS